MILSFIVLVALTVGLTQVVKITKIVPKTLIPLTAVVIGLGLTIIGSVTDITSLTFLSGIAVGLSSVGLFSQKDIVRLLK